MAIDVGTTFYADDLMKKENYLQIPILPLPMGRSFRQIRNLHAPYARKATKRTLGRKYLYPHSWAQGLSVTLRNFIANKSFLGVLFRVQRDT